MKRTTLKMTLLSALLLMGGAIMTGCHDDEEKDSDIPIGGDPYEIVFNKDGEPEYDPIRSIREQMFEYHIGKVSSIARIWYIMSDGNVDINSEAPRILYGIHPLFCTFAIKLVLK